MILVTSKSKDDACQPQQKNKRLTVQYQFARLDKELIDVTILERNGTGYTCPVCSQPMLSKVEGRVNEPHFAHKPGHAPLAKNHDETYLHLMAKNLFYLTFRRCRREELPFIVNVPREKLCPRATLPVPSYSTCRIIRAQMIDAYALFDTIHVEKRDGCRVPDLILLSSITGLKCWVEVFVSHSVDKRKHQEARAANVPILELLVKEQKHLATISAAGLPQSRVQPYSRNF